MVLKIVFRLFALAVVAGFFYFTYNEFINKPRRDPSDKAAVESMQTIIDAQAQYKGKYGRYASALYQLGPPLHGRKGGEESANLIPGDLASGRRFGYQFKVHGYGDTFTVAADPLGTSDPMKIRRHFILDPNGVIRVSEDGPAKPGSPLYKD